MILTVVLDPNIEKKVTEETLPALHRIVDRVAHAAHNNVARHVQSGALLASIRTTKNANGGRVFIGTDHWQYIEYGTKPHVIRPRRKSALWWKDAPHPMRRVRHPGTREYAPMRQALQSVAMKVS